MAFSCLSKLDIFQQFEYFPTCSVSQAKEYFALFKIKLNISGRSKEKHSKKKNQGGGSRRKFFLSLGIPYRFL